MASTCAVVLFVLTCAFCTAKCSFDEKLDRVLKDHKIRQVDSKNPKLHILVAGKTGVGKSTLVNALLGTHIAQVGNGIDRMTKTIDTIKVVRDGIDLYITDTPGFAEHIHIEDSDNDGLSNDNILKEAKEKSKDIDLFLFCIKITDRFADVYARGILDVTRIFGKDIWKKGLFALTFANKITEKEKFMTKLNQWEKVIRKELREIVNKDVAETIPIVPAGFKKPQLFDQPSWVSEFWIQGFRKMDFIAMLRLMSLNKKRMHETLDEVNLTEDNPEDQPLVACTMSRIHDSTIQWIARAVGGTVFGGITLAVPGLQSFVPVAAIAGYFAGDWTGAYVQSLFDFGTKVVRCSDAVVWQSLYTAFVTEYPKHAELSSLSEE